MFSKFFIDRPIFATVLAIIMVLGGLMTLKSLPVAQYPDITPPTVMVVQLSGRGRQDRGRNRRSTHRTAGERR